MSALEARLIELIATLKSACESSRFGLHGHGAVDDDYFAALKYVVQKLEEVLSAGSAPGHGVQTADSTRNSE